MGYILAAFVAMASPQPIDSAVPIRSLERGQTALIAGVVERITDDDEFRIRDDSGAILVYLGPNRVPVATGERVMVEGFVDDDPGPKELYARSVIRADGTTVSLTQGYD